MRRILKRDFGKNATRRMDKRMKVGVISFTEQGKRLSERIGEALQDRYEIAPAFCPGENVVRWAGEQFAEKNALVFVGACGIAVRAVAPYVKDKLKDSPVLVLDEGGNYVIPILSGHVGGANGLARFLAKRLGAAAVITTATDENRVFAVDVFAVKNNLTIVNREGIAKVSAKLLRGEKASVSIEGCFKEPFPDEKEIPQELTPVPYPPGQKTDIVISAEKSVMEKAVLLLRPKEYVLGIGCKKGKSMEEIDRLIREKTQKLSLHRSDIAAIASIDRKKDEEGIRRWAEKNRIPYLTFSVEELRAVQGVFHSSGFVERTVGVDNVCERAALAACGAGGALVLARQAENGITLAAAKKRWKIDWKGAAGDGA